VESKRGSKSSLPRAAKKASPAKPAKSPPKKRAAKKPPPKKSPPKKSPPKKPPPKKPPPNQQPDQEESQSDGPDESDDANVVALVEAKRKMAEIEKDNEELRTQLKRKKEEEKSEKIVFSPNIVVGLPNQQRRYCSYCGKVLMHREGTAQYLCYGCNKIFDL
jgi:hypothetical protein